jgi:radical SAM superfamily enzyme YgiQ (UPF0313 family)
MIHAEAKRRPKLRLINPSSPLSTITMPGIIRQMTFTRKALWTPLSLTCVAASVPADWDVEIIDECTQEAKHRAARGPDVVGITAMTAQAERAYQIADEYRRLGVTVIMGGIHPSAMPAEALTHCDAVCTGDGEPCIAAMLADWRAGRLKKTYDWRDYPEVSIGTPRKDLLRPADYLVFNPIQTTRGCPHGCNFCTTSAIFGRQYRMRPVRDIVEEIREAKERYGSRTFMFSDDNFAGNHAWAMELCAALEPLDIRWASQCDILIAWNDKLLAMMRRSGCLGLILGLESPHADTLSEAGKRFVRPDVYLDRIRRIQAHRINLWGAFIFGFDHDDWRRCRDVVRFAERAGLVMSCYPILTPYPGTQLWADLRRQGRILTERWQLYNGANVVFEPKQFTQAQLRHAQMAGFAEFYSLGSIARRMKVWPPKPRSLAANLAIWKGIRYYYARTRREVPRWRHFLEPQWIEGLYRPVAREIAAEQTVCGEKYETAVASNES